MRHPLKGICEAWLEKIGLAEKVKDSKFSKYAREASNFYDGQHDWMWKEEEFANAKTGGFLDANAKSLLPRFKVQVNKAFEAVALFGPSLFHNYPNILVSPVTPPEIGPAALGMDVSNEMAAQMYQQYQYMQGAEMDVRRSCANVKQHYLNWLQRECDKKTHSRKAITEALVKGWGCLYTKISAPRGSNIRYPRSEYISCDDVVKDGDASYDEDVQYIAIHHIGPRNLLARQWDLPEEALQGHFQSQESQATPRGRRHARSKKQETSTTFDLVEYWEVYSKNGFGDKLTTFTGDKAKSPGDFSPFGDYVYLVLAKGVPFPLNLPSWALEEESAEQLIQRVQWPIPYWIDPNNGGGWPVSDLWFYDKQNCVYPLSMFKSVTGPLRFANWCMSFLADKSCAAATDYIAVAKSAAMEIKNQLETGIGPYTVLEISEMAGKRIEDVVSILKAPDFHIGVWQMVSECLELIDRETGVTELLAGLGGQRQMRSAEEAAVRQSNTQIRPDDMAQRVEDWLSETTRKEMVAAWWATAPEDRLPVLGQAGAEVWEKHISTRDLSQIVMDFDYTIEAGSARKPNIANRIRNLTDLGQVLLPVATQMAGMGMPGPWNAYMKAYGDAIQIDTREFMLPEGMSPPQEQPDPSQDAKVEAMRQKLLFDQEKHDQDMDHSEEKHELDMKVTRKKAAAQKK